VVGDEHVHQEWLAASGAVSDVANGAEILVRRQNRDQQDERKNEAHRETVKE
jgi:hypothetical protein